jgi:hypothetical protein
VRVVAIAVMPGDPIRRGDDIDAVLEERAEKVDVRPHPVEIRDMWLRGDDFVERTRGQDSDRGAPHDFSRVTTDFVGRIAIESDQLKVSLIDDAAHHFRSDVACRELGDTQSCAFGHVTPFGELPVLQQSLLA